MSVIGRSVLELDVDRSKFQKGLRESEREAEGSTGRMSGMFGRVGTAAVAGTAVAAAAIAGMAYKGTSDFIGFERQMNEVFTLLPGISQAAMDDMSRQVRDFSKEFGTLPQEVVPALYQALSAGVPEDNVFEFLEVAQKAAIGGVTELETAVDGITTVVNSYGAEVIDAGEASDLMFTAVRLGKTTFDELSASMFQVTPLASSLGVGFDQITAATASLTAQGVPTSVAMTQLRSLFTALSDAGSDLDETIRAQLGGSFEELTAQGVDVGTILNTLRTTMPDEEFRQLFGRVEATNAALALTGDNFEGFSENLSEMQNSLGATDAAFEVMDQGIGRSIERIRAAIAVMWLDIGEALAPAVAAVANWIVDYLPKATEAVGRLMGGVISMGERLQGIPALISPLTSALSPLVTTLIDTGTAIRSLITGDFETFYSTVLELPGPLQALMLGFDQVRGGIERVVGAFREGGLAGMFAQIRDEIPNLGQVLLDTGQAIATGIWESISNVDWSEVASSVWGGITTALSVGLDALQTIATIPLTFYSWLYGQITEIDWRELGSTVLGAIADAITSAAIAVGQVGQNVYNWISENVLSLEWGEMAGNVLSAIGSAIVTAATTVAEVGGAIYGWISGAISGVEWGELGSSILSAIGSAISSAIGAVEFAASSVYDWIAPKVGEIEWGELGSSILGGIGSAIGAARSGVAGVGSAIHSWVSDDVGSQDFGTVGTGIGESISSGITGGLQALENVGDRFAPLRRALDWIRDTGAPAVSSLASVISSRVSPAFTTIANLGRDLWRVLGEELGPTWRQLTSTMQAAAPIYRVLATVIGAVAVAVGVTMLGSFRGFMEFARNVLPPVLQVTFALFRTLLVIIENVADTITTAVRVVGAIFRGEWREAFQLASDLVDRMRARVIGVITDLATSVGNLISGLVSGVIGYFRELFNTLVGRSIIPDLVNRITGLIRGLRDSVLGYFGNLKDRAIARIREMYESVTGVVSDLRVSVVRTIRGARDVLARYWDEIKEKATGIWDSITTHIEDGRQAMISALRAPFEWFRDNIGSIMASAASFALRPLNSIISGINTLGAGLVRGLRWIGETLGVESLEGIQWTNLNPIGTDVAVPRLDARGRAMAHGGIIDEPIEGVGLWSGRRYQMGEGGKREAVVPLENTIDPRVARVLAMGVDPVPDAGDVDMRHDHDHPDDPRLAFPAFADIPHTFDDMGGAVGVGGFRDALRSGWDTVKEGASDVGSFLAGLPSRAMDWLSNGAEWALERVLERFPLDIEFPGKLAPAGGALLTTVKDAMLERIKEALGLLQEAKDEQEAAEQAALMVGEGSYSGGLAGWFRPTTGVITQLFGQRLLPGYGAMGHTGIDIANAQGTPIRAANSGRVSATGWMGGYGNAIRIVHNGLSTLYAHLMPGGILASVGQIVRAGDVIGRMGTTGYSTGPHLHFELIRGNTPINPMGTVPFHQGGVIPEDIVGVGGSGTRYSFLGGEHVVPRGGVPALGGEDSALSDESTRQLFDTLRAALNLAREMALGAARLPTREFVSDLKHWAEHAITSVGDTIAYLDKVRGEDFVGRAGEGAEAVGKVIGSLQSAFDFASAAGGGIRTPDAGVVSSLKFMAEHALTSIGDTIAHIDRIRDEDFVSRAGEGAQAIGQVFGALQSAFDFAVHARGGVRLDPGIISTLKFYAEHAVASIGDTVAYLDHVRQAGFVERASAGAQAVQSVFGALQSAFDFASTTASSRVTVNAQMVTDMKFAAEHALASIGDTIAYLDHTRHAGFVERASAGAQAIGQVFSSLTAALDFGRMTREAAVAVASRSIVTELKFAAEHALASIGDTIRYLDSVRNAGFIERAGEGAAAIGQVFAALQSAFDFAQHTGGNRPTYISYARLEELANFAGQAVIKLGAVIQWIDSERRNGFVERAGEAGQAVQQVFGALSSAFTFANMTEGNRPTYISYARLEELANFAGQAIIKLGAVVRWIDSERKAGFVERAGEAGQAIQGVFGALQAAFAFANFTEGQRPTYISYARLEELANFAGQAILKMGDVIRWIDTIRAEGFLQRAQDGASAIQAAFGALQAAFDFAGRTEGQSSVLLSSTQLQRLATFAQAATLQIGDVIRNIDRLRSEGFLQRAQEGAAAVQASFGALTSAFDFAGRTEGESSILLSSAQLQRLSSFAQAATLQIGDVIRNIDRLRSEGFLQRAQEGGAAIQAAFGALTSAFDFAGRTDGTMPHLLSSTLLQRLADFAQRATLQIGDVVRNLDRLRGEGWLQRISEAAPAIRDSFGALGEALTFANAATSSLADGIDVAGARKLVGSLQTLIETIVRSFDQAARALGGPVLDSAQRFAEAARPVLEVANSAINAVGGIVRMQEILPRDQEMFVRNIRRLADTFGMANAELDRMGIEGADLEERMAVILDTARRLTDMTTTFTSSTDLQKTMRVEVYLNGRTLGSELAPHIVDEIRLRTGSDL